MSHLSNNYYRHGYVIKKRLLNSVDNDKVYNKYGGMVVHYHTLCLVCSCFDKESLINEYAISYYPFKLIVCHKHPLGLFHNGKYY